jgi:transcriptional regulator GlxA family with amidase domain
VGSVIRGLRFSISFKHHEKRLARRTKLLQYLPMLRDVLLFIYPGVQPIDLAGPMQAFITADEEMGGGAYRVRTASTQRSAIQLAGGLPVLASSLPRKSPDTLLLPGGPGVHAARKDVACLAAVRRLARGSRRVGSICTGAFLLASSGLLEGREAATHWRACTQLALEFPGVRVRADPIWVRDGSVWTSAGVTAGIDLALALIEEDLGAALALRVARRLVVPMRRSGGQSQHSDTLALQDAAQFGPLLEWIVGNLGRTLTIEVLAERAGMAPRSFHRHFLARTGVTPAEAVERLRLDRARTLLEVVRLPLSAVAEQAGFGSVERFRRAFKRGFGVSPRDYDGRISQ